MISKETATDIALAYREIENAEKLLENVRKSLADRSAPDVRDVFGRLQGGLQLGVPSGDRSTSLYNVPWSVVEPILKLHIATHKAAIKTLTEKAMIEGGGA